MSVKTKTILAPTHLTDPVDALTTDGQVQLLDTLIETWVDEHPDAEIISISHQQSTGVIHRDQHMATFGRFSKTNEDKPAIETCHYFSAMIVYQEPQSSKESYDRLLKLLGKIIVKMTADMAVVAEELLDKIPPVPPPPGQQLDDEPPFNSACGGCEVCNRQAHPDQLEEKGVED